MIVKSDNVLKDGLQLGLRNIVSARGEAGLQIDQTTSFKLHTM